MLKINSNTKEHPESLPKAALFNGTSDYIEIPDSNAFSVPTTGAITVSIDIRPDVLDFITTIDGGADGRYIDWLGKGDYLAPTQFEWNFRMYNSTSPTRPNRISFYVFNIGGGIGVGSYFQDTIKKGEWITVTAKIDATKTYIYKNGLLRDSDVYTASITPANGIAPVRIGTTALGDPSFFKGGMKNFRFWNRGLSDAEVLANAQGNPPQSGLVCQLSLTDGKLTSAKDSIGSTDGTIHGATYTKI